MAKGRYQQLSSASLSKVPEVTAFFWILKLLTTAMGEATSDYFVNRINPFAAVAIGGVCFVVAIALQFAVNRYVAWIYWLTVAMVAIFGTMCADAIHIQFSVPYAVTSVVFVVILAAVFLTWQRSEHTLSIHSITTPRRECFYWATILSTFALGTATGDLAATTFNLGYFKAGVVFVVLILLTASAYVRLSLNAIVAFWTAYILTRPIGASFADWSSKPHSVGGLAYGDGPVAGGLVLLIVVLVAYLQVTRVDVTSTN